MTFTTIQKTILLALIISTYSYGQESYPKHTGDIDFDEKIDKSDFKLCYPDYIYQYFNTSKGVEYTGEKIALEKEVREKYLPADLKGESGLIRIRFIVNCKGETDRFRLISMDTDYHPKTFDKSITDQLMEISKNLKGWEPKLYENDGKEYTIDYYQYLIFKLKDGHITQILP
jgi:hypothetical protein